MKTDEAEAIKTQNKKPKERHKTKKKKKKFSGEDFLSNSIPLGILFYFIYLRV